jgi:transposase
MTMAARKIFADLQAQLIELDKQVAAWLGLVPRQDSSGGKSRLLGISKRGDVYLRTLLIHGARAVVNAAANKNARIVWALLTQSEHYEAPVAASV